MSYSDDGMLRLPNPMDESLGYAIGSAPAPAPEGMVFVPGLNTYVDHDIAAQLGLGAPQSPARQDAPQGAPEVSLSRQPEGFPEELGREISDEELEEMSEVELEALVEELEVRSEREPALSPTLDDIAACFGDQFDAAVDRMVVGTPEETLSELVEATGLDAQTASALVEAAVLEAEPIASENIGNGRWRSIVYAAAATDDPFARRVVSDFVQGKLHPSKLMSAYGMWYESLPDAEG